MMSASRRGSLYVSAEARSRLLERYEAILKRWRELTGLELERRLIPNSAGETAVLAFGPGPEATLGARPIGKATASGGQRPLVLLHGTLSNSSMWLADAAALGAGRRVYMLDIPGEPGLSEERDLDWQDSGSAAWLGEVIAGLGLEAFDICGLSIGGWIGLAYAIERPRKLRSLVLLCPSGIGRPRGSFIWKALLQQPRGRAGREAIVRSLYGDARPPQGAIEAGTELALATCPRFESPRIFSDEELAKIQARLFLAVGEKDVMLRSQESVARLARAKPEAGIHLLPGAGHALLGLAPRVVEFLDRR